MQDLVRPKERHSWIVFTTVLVLLLSLASGFYIAYIKGKAVSNEESGVSGEETVIVDEVSLVEEPPEEGFEELDEPVGTPEEIDNTVVDELDALIDYIDNEAVSDDLSDLDM